MMTFLIFICFVVSAEHFAPYLTYLSSMTDANISSEKVKKPLGKKFTVHLLPI